MIHHSSDRLFNRILWAIFAIALLLGLYRVYGYYIHDIPHGYDPGFFRYALESARAALPGLPPPPPQSLPYHEPLFGILGSVLIFSGLSIDTIIGPFLGFLSVFTAFGMYFVGKQVSHRQVGLVAASIFLISIVQFQEYWWNYWRNIVGIIFILFSLGLVHRKSYLAIITIAGLYTIHRPSALYFTLLVLILLVIEWLRYKQFPYKKIGILIIASCIALPLYINQLNYLTDMVEPLSTTIGGVSSSGTFFTTREFFFSIFPYFLVLIPAIFAKMEKKEFDIILVGFLLGLTWSVLRLFFYNRMLIFFDIFAILLAAYSIVYVIGKWPKRYLYGLMVIFFSLQGYLYTVYAYEYSGRHTISKEEFDIVNNLDILIPRDASILSTHRGYTPWLLGYSQRHTLAGYIAVAGSQNLINTTNRNFRPDDTITRAEAMKILVLALDVDMPSIEGTSFADVDTKSDLARYIESAKSLKIISGQYIGSKLMFRPSDSVTRAEIAKILVNGFGL